MQCVHAHVVCVSVGFMHVGCVHTWSACVCLCVYLYMACCSCGVYGHVACASMVCVRAGFVLCSVCTWCVGIRTVSARDV